MAKFGVNVVVLVDNMPLVFFYCSPKPFKKKFLHSLYYEKNIRTKLPTKKKNSCRGNFSTPLPGYLMVHPLVKQKARLEKLKMKQQLAEAEAEVEVYEEAEIKNDPLPVSPEISSRTPNE